MMRKSLCQHDQHIQGSWFSLSTRLYLRFLSSVLHPALGRMWSCWSVQQKPQSCSRERWSHPWSLMVSKFPSNTNYCMTAWFCGWQHCCKKRSTEHKNTTQNMNGCNRSKRCVSLDVPTRWFCLHSFGVWYITCYQSHTGQRDNSVEMKIREVICQIFP